MERRDHWNRIYDTRASDQLSWTQRDAATSLAMLARAGFAAGASVIDVGGGESPLVDALLDAGAGRVVVLDIAPAALARAQARLGAARAARVEWIAADVAGDWSIDGPVDYWHDRALFHFLTEAADREAYVRHVARTLRPGGAVVIATFALDGPEKCSGLPVVRYAPETLQQQFGPAFAVEDTTAETHVTPWGTGQSFVFTSLRYRGAAAR